MFKRILFALIVVVFAAIPAVAQKGKLTVCHFTSNGDVRLLSIAPSALKAHLDHGDVEAPPSVKTDADCLAPQPPPAPVATTATTDAQGASSFVIPSTNVIARVTASDSNGAAVAGAMIELLVIDDDVLVIAVDPQERFAPGFAGAKLSSAHPGSALQLSMPIVLPPIVGPPPQIPPPTLVAGRFVVREYCFTQDEFRQFIQSSVDQGLSMATSVVMAPLGGFVVKQLLARTIWAQRKISSVDIAREVANEAFSGRDLAIRMRVYSPPASPNLQLYPLFFEELGHCGGACCQQGAVCEPKSSDAKCFGDYYDGKPCKDIVCKEGACCVPGAGCSVLLESECRKRGGRYMGNDTKCLPDPCREGACCVPGAGCSVMLMSECATRGGKYQGDNTTCSPDPCKKGACCDPKTGCTVLAELECAQRNGNYHGDDTTCDRISGTQTLVYNFVAGGGAPSATLRIPFTHGTIRSTVVLAPNIVNGQCVRDWRVEFFAYPFGSGRSGGTMYAGQQFGICRTQPETITFQQMNPSSPCSTYSVNPLTGMPAQVTIEVIPP